MRRYISAYFTDEEDLLRASKTLIDKKIQILDVLTPFPVHGLDKVLGLKVVRSGKSIYNARVVSEWVCPKLFIRTHISSV